MTPSPELKERFDTWRQQGYLLSYAPCGSRYTCSPPPFNTDEDWLILCASKERMQTLEFILVSKEGFEKQEEYTHDSWCSIRDNEFNFILLFDPLEFTKFCLARDVCKELNVMDKADRKLIHNAVMYGHKGEEE